MSHRVPAALLILAAGLPAADVIQLRNDRASQQAVLADDELLIISAPATSGGLAASSAAPRLERTIGRASAQDRAKALLARGEASRVAPVLYLDGRMGDPQARAYATRRILIGTIDGAAMGAVALKHGLRLVEAVSGRPGWWIVEPTASGVFAPIDAAASLAGEAALELVYPLLHMPAARRHDPNDPIFSAGYMWHLLDGPAESIHIREVWDDFKGFRANIAINDDGVQITHPDLDVRANFSRDYVQNVPDGNHKRAGDGHGTVVAGLAAAIGDNGIGVTGVAFQSRIISNRILEEFDPNHPSITLAPDDQLRRAMTVQMLAPHFEMTWASNNSWGVPDTGTRMSGPGPLMMVGLEEGTTLGRARRGIPYIFACGNGGSHNPNQVQDCTAFEGYLNRFTIGVAALKHSFAAPTNIPLYKAEYSESGPNLTISAFGGSGSPDNNSALAIGAVSTDRTGDDGYVRANIGDPLFQSGDYTPPVEQMQGTSFAAPIVAGCVTLMGEARPALSYRDMRLLMMHRGQDRLPRQRNPTTGLHDDWATWRENAAGLLYNNWYGFGAVDVGRFIYGGDGTRANFASTGARDEPGALLWPLVPPLLRDPLRYQGDFPIPSNDLSNPDVYAIFDAPSWTDNDLVPDGRPAVGSPVTRAVSVPMRIDSMPERFRVDSVELTVELQALGSQSYPGGAAAFPFVNGKPRFQGPTGAGEFNWGDYAFRLTSPNGTTAILGRQRPGRRSATSGSPRRSEIWTFTELFHVNETNVEGVWTLSIIDEANDVADDPINDPQAQNPPQARVRSVDLKIYGHQTYATPSLGGTSVGGVASAEGAQRVTVSGSGFALSQGGDAMTQAYWQALDAAGVEVGPPVAIATQYSSTSKLEVDIPGSLLDESMPGQGLLFAANPAVVVGRSLVADAFDTPNTLMPGTVSSPTAGTFPITRRVKRNPSTEDKLIRYSRRPTLTAIPDLILKEGGTFNVSTVAFDPDVAAGLPTAVPENLTLTVTSYNPSIVPPGSMTVARPPDATGLGTYALFAEAVKADSGFALIEVKVTDGVITTSRAFRVVIPTDEDGSGCGGGMGLALLGIPLAAWFVRRRRRS